MKLRLALSCGLLAVALAGCGDDAPDEPEASATPSSPESSATASERPSPTFDPKKETAKEFIRRWIRLGNEMQLTGETEEYLAITSGECRSCNQFAERIEGIYEDGGWIKTKGERIASMTHDLDAQWTVKVNVYPTRYAETAEDTTQTFPGGKVTYVVYIAKDDGKWTVTDYSELSS